TTRPHFSVSSMDPDRTSPLSVLRFLAPLMLWGYGTAQGLTTWVSSVASPVAVSAVSFVLFIFTHFVLLSLATSTSGVRPLDIPSSTSTRHVSSAVFITDHILYQRSVKDSLWVLYAIFYSLSMVVVLYTLSVMRRLILGKQEYERIIERNACVVAVWKKKRKQARIQAVLKALADAREKEARAHTKVLERNEWLADQIRVSECERAVDAVALEGAKEELRNMEDRDALMFRRMTRERVEKSKWKWQYQECQTAADAQSRRDAKLREATGLRHDQVEACQFAIHAITMRIQALLKKELADSRAANATLTIRCDELNQRVSSLTASLRTTCTLYRTRVDVLKRRIDQGEARGTALEGRLTLSTAQHQTELEKRKRELADANSHIAELKKQAMDEDVLSLALRSEVRDANAQLSLVSQGLEEAEKKLKCKERQLSAERRRHEATRNAYLVEKLAADALAGDLTAENRDLRAQIALAIEASTLLAKLQVELEAEKDSHKQAIAQRLALEGSLDVSIAEHRMHMEQCSRDWAAARSLAAEAATLVTKLQDELDAEKESHRQVIAQYVALEGTLESSALEYKTHMEQCSRDRIEAKDERDGLEHRLALVSEGFGEAEAKMRCNARELYVERQRHEATIEAYRAGQRMGDTLVDNLMAETEELRMQQSLESEDNQDQPGVEQESQAIPKRPVGASSLQTPLQMRCKSRAMAEILKRRNLAAGSRSPSPLLNSPA
ncbi:hypothetical protein BDW22DRAFT_1357284, partial [Trametopsis cervina]